MSDEDKAQFELVLSGYAHDGNEQVAFISTIPKALFNLFFEFHFTNAWNKQYHASGLQISFNNAVRHTGQDTSTIYGNHAVKPNERYEWKLQITKMCRRSFYPFNLYIGIVKNDVRWMGQHLNDHKWCLHNMGYRLEIATFKIYKPHYYYHGDDTIFNDNGSDSKVEEGDIILIDIDMTNGKNSIKFEVKDKRYLLTQTAVTKPAEYRLACTFSFSSTGSILQSL